MLSNKRGNKKEIAKNNFKYRKSKNNFGLSSHHESNISADQIAMRRAKPQRSNLVKFLEEVGYEDIFDSNEVNEIKEMLSNSNPGSMTKNELILDSIKTFTHDNSRSESKEELIIPNDN